MLARTLTTLEDREHPPRRRLRLAVQESSLVDAFLDPDLRADLDTEAASGGPSALVTPEMLAQLWERTARRSASLLPPRADGPTVVVLVPGLMASSLLDTAEGGRGLIWAYPDLVEPDALAALRLGPCDAVDRDHDHDYDPAARIVPRPGSPLLYDLLRLALEDRGHIVEVMPVDWRKNLEPAALRLAARLRRLGAAARRICLVAHSQGALVARRAAHLLGPAEARRLVDRLILLAPANFGTLAAAYALAGQGGPPHQPWSLRGHPPSAEARRVWGSMTGLYQTLPWDPDRLPWLATHDLTDPAHWPAEVDRERLRHYVGWGSAIDTDALDDRTTVILGDNHGAPTVGGIRRVDGRIEEARGYGLPGDGVVPHACAVLPGTPAYLAPGTTHASLATDRMAIDAVVGLVEHQPVRLRELSSHPADHLALRSDPRPLTVSTSTFELNGAFLKPPAPEAGPGHGAGEDPRDGRSLREFQAASPLHLPLPLSRPDYELILESGNFLPFDFLRVGDRIGRAVVKLQRGDGAVGTGFLVAPDILLTNNHVLPDEDTAGAAYALANYERKPPDDPGGRPAVARLRPDLLFITNAELDFTFCSVEGVDFLGTVPLHRDSFGVVTHEYVNIIQHPRGRPKEVALQDNLVVRADNLVVQYSCDTEPGSSGSPVFNNQWRLIALHHASVVTDVPGGRHARSEPDPSVRYLNEGIRLSAIAVWLETFEPESPAQRRQVERLRAIFEGLDPQIGFFGALGRKSEGKSAAQVIAESYRGDSGSLDVAFWDLHGLDGFVRDRLDDLSQVVATMGMDVWVLSHVDPIKVDALCEYLETCYRLDYRRCHERSPGPDRSLSIIYRRSAALGVEVVGGDEPGRPFRLRVRRRSRQGETRGVCIVPLPYVGPSDGCPNRAGHVLAAALDPGDDDWLLLGASPSLREQSYLEALRDASGRTVLAAEGRDGSAILAAAPRSQVDRIYTSPNLTPVLGDSGGLIVAGDRDLPVGIRLFGEHRPIAVRLTWHEPDPARAAGPAPAPPAPPASAPPIEPFPEEALERALRGMLDRMIAEGRLQVTPGGPAAP